MSEFTYISYLHSFQGEYVWKRVMDFNVDARNTYEDSNNILLRETVEIKTNQRTAFNTYRSSSAVRKVYLHCESGAIRCSRLPGPAPLIRLLEHPELLLCRVLLLTRSILCSELCLNIHTYIHAYIHTYIHTYIHLAYGSRCRCQQECHYFSPSSKAYRLPTTISALGNHKLVLIVVLVLSNFSEVHDVVDILRTRLSA